MGFPTDGSNHYKAIKSEIMLYEYNSQIESIFNKRVKNYSHLGGTKNKTDVKIIFEDGTHENITLKTKKDIKSGSFDWVNTTNFCKEMIKKSFDIFTKYKGSNDSKHKLLLENMIKSELEEMESDTLTKIFINQVYESYIKYELKVLIIDEKTKKIYLVKPKIFDLITNNFKLKLSSGKGKTSFKIFCEKDGFEKIDLGLRVRIHLNNGWTKWHKGEGSVLCLKFQQDAVYKMLN